MEAEPSVFVRVFNFGLALLPHWWLLVTGIVLAIEPMIEAYVPRSWKVPIDQRWPNEKRHRHLRLASIAALLIASFFAFDDVSVRNRILQRDASYLLDERDEARRQREANVSPMIERLSSDLTAARAQIDAQTREIIEQRTELEKLLHPPHDPAGIYVDGERIGTGRHAQIVNNQMEFSVIETQVPLTIGGGFEFGDYRLRFIGSDGTSMSSMAGGIKGFTYRNARADVLGKLESDK